MSTPIPTAAVFVASFPEFNTAPLALVNAKLTEAAQRTSSTIFPSTETRDQAVMYRAAILLIASPFGINMRTNAPDQAYAYEFTLRQLQRASSMGVRVF